MRFDYRHLMSGDDKRLVGGDTHPLTSYMRLIPQPQFVRSGIQAFIEFLRSDLLSLGVVE